MTGALKPCCLALSVLLEQRLLALNEIGAQAHPARRWRFELMYDCRLEVGHKRGNNRYPETVFELQRGMDLDVAFDAADQAFDVHPLASANADAPHLGTLLESKAWTDAVQADLLLQLLIRDCGVGAPATAG